MVRVGSLVDMAAVSPEEVDSKSGMRPREQLKAVYEAVPGLHRRSRASSITGSAVCWPRRALWT